MINKIISNLPSLCNLRQYHRFNYKLPQGDFSSDNSLNCAAIERLGGKEPVSAKDLLWGCLLGDGYCNPRGCITLRHSIAQAPYLFWKWEVLRLEGLISQSSQPRLVVQRDQRTEKWNYSLRFNTRTLFRGERSTFYPTKLNLNPGSFTSKDTKVQKTIPALENTLSRWTPAALAVWYMDDGGLGGHSQLGCVIDVSCWGDSGRQEIRHILKSVYNLESTLQGKKAKAQKLFIPKRSAHDFRDLISPYVVPTMGYKIAHLF